MSRPLRMLPSARFEMLDASDFYDSKSEGLGDRFLSDVDRSFRLIQEAPRRWPQPIRGFHRARLHDFPYGVLQKLSWSQSLICAVGQVIGFRDGGINCTEAFRPHPAC